jgi:hypothetical protein
MSANASAQRRRAALLFAFGFALSLSGRAWAEDELGRARDFDPPPQRRPPLRRQFGLMAVAMPYDGFGLGVRALGPRVGLDLSFGYRPIFATHGTDPDEFPRLALLEGYQLNAALYVGLYRPNPRTDLGFALGYKYNTLVRHGVGAAFYLQRELAEHFAFLLFVGPAVFPRAEREIREKTGWADGSVSSGISWHQGGLGVALVLYP